MFRYPDEDLSQLGQMHELRSILVWSAKLLRLDGIELLKKLRTAEFTYCRNLSDISVVGGIQSLRSLTFAHCKRLNDLQPIAKSKGLEELLIQNCGEIDSLKPIEKCRGLKTLQVSGNCLVKDGDFSGLKKLAKLRRVLIRHRIHYSHRDVDIERI